MDSPPPHTGFYLENYEQAEPIIADHDKTCILACLVCKVDISGRNTMIRSKPFTILLQLHLFITAVKKNNPSILVSELSILRQHMMKMISQL